MASIPIASGIYSTQSAELRTSLPVNLMPVPLASGVSGYYLRPADGLESVATGQGVDRGGIYWQGTHYRVSGTKLVSVAGAAVTELGDVGPGGHCSFDYGFDALAIASGGRLYYWDGFTLVQSTDADLGQALDVVWVDGYYMTTDGESLVVSELNDRLSVNPLKYGSSEAAPDPIVALEKIRTEVYAINRYTTEVFDNVGGDLFPFSRIDGAQVLKGAVGKDAACPLEDAIAILGGGRNEPCSVYLIANGSYVQVSTDEVDRVIQSFSESELASVVIESRLSSAHKLLYIHLPDRTLVYDAGASKALGVAVWFTLTSSLAGNSQYRGRGFVWTGSEWMCGDPTGTDIGRLTYSKSSHWGDDIGMLFSTPVVYNEGRGAIFSELELVALPGRALLGDDPTIWTSYSTDGQTWSNEFPISAGKTGEREKRLCWRRQGRMSNYRIQRFRWTSDAHLSVVRLEAKFEPLA